MAKRGTATYVYCVVRGVRGVRGHGPPDTSGAPPSLPGVAPPRALDLGAGLWAIAATAPLPDFSAEALEAHLSDLEWVSDCAVAHEGVVEHFSTPGPAVPMKLFTLYSRDERAVADLAGRRQELAALLDRLAGRVEWGIRIRFAGAGARRGSSQEAATTSVAVTRPTSGTGFLRAKQQQWESARTRGAAAARAVEEAWADLAAGAVEARRRDLADAPAAAGLLLDAALLAPASGTEDLERRVEEISRRLAESGCEVTLTGPWPPYNFVQDEP